MKTRLLGAAVLIALAVIFVPMFFSSNPTPPGGDKNISLDIPSEPAADMQTRTMNLTPGAPASSATAVATAASPAPAAAPTTAAAGTPPAAAPAVTPTPAPAPATGPLIPHAGSGSGNLAHVEIKSQRPQDVDSGPGSDAPEPVIPDRRRHPLPPATAVTLAPTVAASPKPVPARAPKPTTVVASEAPAAAGEPTAVAAHGHYNINLSAYASSDSARSLITRVRALGYPAQAQALNQGGRTLALVTAGPFESRAAAEAARLKIAQSIPGVPARLQSGASNQTGDAPVAAAPSKAAASTTPAAVASPAPASHAGGFAVQLAAMGNAGDANALRDKLRAGGFTAYVDAVDAGGKHLWRVRAGPQTQRADAAKLRDQIHAKLGLSGNIVTTP